MNADKRIRHSRIQDMERLRMLRDRLQESINMRRRSVEALENQIVGIDATIEIVKQFPDDDEHEAR